MNATVFFINSLALICFLAALAKDGRRTLRSLREAVKTFILINPDILIIIILIGLLLGFIPPAQISKTIGEHAGVIGVLVAALIGTIVHVSALIAFPLAGSLLKSGASVAAIAAFISTLTMIGTVTLPLEIKKLGFKMAMLRNIFSFIISLLIAWIMGVCL